MGHVKVYIREKLNLDNEMRQLIWKFENSQNLVLVSLKHGNLLERINLTKEVVQVILTNTSPDYLRESGRPHLTNVKVVLIKCKFSQKLFIVRR